MQKVLLVLRRRGRLSDDDRARRSHALRVPPAEIEPADRAGTQAAVTELADAHHRTVHDAACLELARRLRSGVVCGARVTGAGSRGLCPAPA